MKPLIQILLIVAVLFVAIRISTARGARSKALRRIGILVFTVFAVWSIIDPGVWTRIANAVGVGRGTDMVLYALVIAFLCFVLIAYLNFAELEMQYTQLARRIALDEALRQDAAMVAASPTTTVAGDGASTAAGNKASTTASSGDGQS